MLAVSFALPEGNFTPAVYLYIIHHWTCKGLGARLAGCKVVTRGNVAPEPKLDVNRHTHTHIHVRRADEKIWISKMEAWKDGSSR